MIAIPTNDATICGRQMVQLNKPIYEPSDLPVRAFVSNANGKANIAAHAQPISKNDTARVY
jgi:hypothetical protein